MSTSFSSSCSRKLRNGMFQQQHTALPGKGPPNTCARTLRFHTHLSSMPQRKKGICLLACLFAVLLWGIACLWAYGRRLGNSMLHLGRPCPKTDARNAKRLTLKHRRGQWPVCVAHVVDWAVRGYTAEGQRKRRHYYNGPVAACALWNRAAHKHTANVAQAR